MRDRSHDEAMTEMFKEHPTFAAQYLNQLLQDGGAGDLLVALRQMAIARGGVRAIAKETELNANQLYRMLSPEGNPELRSLAAVLKALGLRLAVQPIDHHRAWHESEHTREKCPASRPSISKISSTPNEFTHLAVRDT